jgi:CheY-like chemotaxis protein
MSVKLPCHHGDGPPRALIIEDDVDVRVVLAWTLEPEGYEVRHAEHGRVALDQVYHWAPCLVLLDLMMPVMDGPTFRREMRALERAAEIPVVLMSARC